MIRHKYDIPPQCCTCDEEGVCDDCCCAFWCGCCTTAQVARPRRRPRRSTPSPRRAPRRRPRVRDSRDRHRQLLLHDGDRRAVRSGVGEHSLERLPHPLAPPFPLLAEYLVTTSRPRVGSAESNKTHGYTRNWSPEGQGSPNFNASMAAHFPAAWYSPTITVRGSDPSTAPLCKVCVSTTNPPPFAPQSFATS